MLEQDRGGVSKQVSQRKYSPSVGGVSPCCWKNPGKLGATGSFSLERWPAMISFNGMVPYVRLTQCMGGMVHPRGHGGASALRQGVNPLKRFCKLSWAAVWFKGFSPPNEPPKKNEKIWGWYNIWAPCTKTITQSGKVQGPRFKLWSWRPHSHPSIQLNIHEYISWHNM